MLIGAYSAHGSGLAIYPVQGLYGLERTDCDHANFAGIETAKIAPELCEELSLDRRVALGQRFASEVRSAFPNVIQNIGLNVESGERPEARLSKTAIASLHLSRADLWVVHRPASLDVYVPITVSIFITNALSGEVLFVDNYSTILQGNLSEDHYLEQSRREFDKALDGAVDALVKEAASRFKPFALSGEVRAKLGSRYVFDVGRRGGVREGDVMGADAKAVFSDATYSIIEPVLGDLKVGQALSREVAQPVDVLAKPSALVVVAHYPQGTSQGLINAIFEDAVGQGSILAITPVNPSFSSLRSMMLGDAKVAGSYDNARLTPDYFIRLSVFQLDPLDVETNLSHARRSEFEAIALVEVIDHSGRVIYATQAANKIEDQVLYGVAFSPDQRRDTVVRNALVEAAAKLNKGFKPARLRLDARPAGTEVDIADTGGALSLGFKALLIRKQGTISGVSGEVWSPAGALEVTEVSNGGVRARFEDVDTQTARAGDKVAFEGGANASQSRRWVAPCEDADGQPVVRNKGSLKDNLYGEIALNTFAAAFPAPYRPAHFAAELAGSLSQFSDAARLGVMHPQPADICVEPVYQIDPVSEKLVGTGLVSPIYQVAMGFNLREKGQRVGGGALQQTLTATAIPASADAGVRNSALQFDLGPVAESLTNQVVHSLNPIP